MIDDRGHMRTALGLARRGLGQVAPNPAVGCVLVKDGRVVGRGWTQPGGRPHAETEALRRAGAEARGAVAYVTLEPCAHHGQTPPCADALIAAGVARVVMAAEDPDPRVSGRGAARLEAAGITVERGLLSEAALELNDGFIRRIRDGRPLVTLKLATTLDGRIATHAGESRWITGDLARARAHRLRRDHDAIMVGSGTVLADDPLLTVRLAGLDGHPPARIIADGRLRTPLTAKLIAEAREIRTLLVTLADADPIRRRAFEDCGVEMVTIHQDAAGTLDLDAALEALGGLGFTRLLVEGGATVAASLLRAGLVDRLAWFHSAAIIGGDGIAAVKPFGVDALADRAIFTRLTCQELGEDILETFVHSS